MWMGDGSHSLDLAGEKGSETQDLVDDDRDSDFAGEVSSQLLSVVSDSTSLGSFRGLASQQFVHDFPEWHLVEHGFPTFLQEHCFPEHPFLQLQDAP